MAYKATFTPQAWVNDHANEVDPEGETTFDITPEVMLLIAQGKKVPESNTNESDNFQRAANAPAWIKNWSGPFYITVEEVEGEYLPVGVSILSFKGEIGNVGDLDYIYTGANAVGKITHVDTGREDCYTVRFPVTGNIIRLSVEQLNNGAMYVITDAAEDIKLSRAAFESKYNPTAIGEYPAHTRSMWREMVSESKTIDGYWDWAFKTLKSSAPTAI